MGVIFTHSIPDNTRGFTIALIGVQIHFIHRVQDTPLYRL